MRTMRGEDVEVQQISTSGHRDEVEELLPFTDNKGAIMPALLKVAMALVALSAVQSVAGAQTPSRLSLYRRLFRS